MEHYNPSETEAKWQKKWAESKLHAADLNKAKNPFYSLAMFPYPSGDKLHVGHWYNYAPADSFARYKRMRGFDVFEPMGFDAFGLPAENYAIKTGTPPAQSTAKNIETMIEQLSRIGCMYDWDKTLATTDPEYYRWTQWLFLQMFEHKLAYKKNANVNWCPKDQTVLANEQVKAGLCERCGTAVTQKPLTQWFWKITDYADKLVDNLDDLDWPEKTKLVQKNWIGRSEGVNFRQKVKDLDIEFEVYDSIPQTFLAQTFTVIAPDHPMVKELIEGTEGEREVTAFVERIKEKKMTNKFKIEEDMEGIFTGRYVENPFGTGDLPIWIASYVLADYGTGIVNCSAHDERDFAFAKKYGIPLKIAMLPADPALAKKVENFEKHYLADDGILLSPEPAKGMKWKEAREMVIDYIEGKKFGTRRVNYRLRDWLVSRQRYWGAPIPIVYDPEGNPHPIPEKHLPWLLPTDVEFKPTGKSPLVDSKEFLERTEAIFGKGWTPEYDTMDTFVCSSFYYLRFLANGDAKHLIDPSTEKKWMPVNMYIGGPEHATMHLLYARFVMMALKDCGVVSHEEPFEHLFHQGLITKDGAKMSKSKGNVISPDSFVENYGADVFRMYLMFMGPFSDGGDWSDTGINGIVRFVQRITKILPDKLNKKVEQDSRPLLGLIHKSIKMNTDNLERLQFNTCISSLMELLNAIEKEEGITTESAQVFIKLLAPLAPHLADELWEMSGGKGFVVEQEWPTHDPVLLVADTLTIAVQVNGKLRATIDVPAAMPKEDIIGLAKRQENVVKFLEGKEPKKEIYVPGKLVSIVV